MSAPPLASCIMPTYNRRAFVPLAIEYFLRQDYPNRELLILDDGTDRVEDLVPEHESIRYIPLEARLSLGAKRNLACEQARGEIIVHWDDDDWFSPQRVTRQVAALTAAGADICGLDRVLFIEPDATRAWEYRYPAGQRPWAYGASLCYTREFWRRHRFPEIQVGEDACFVWSDPGARLALMEDNTILVSLVHPLNTSPKQTADPQWNNYPVSGIAALIGPDLAHYLPAAAARDKPVSHPAHERSVPMLAVAKAADLSLPEFAAFNHGVALPRMRRWELPFVLFHGRMDNTLSVLDCTVNPAGFGERIARLYPHVLYRHWSPIQGGGFALPVGIPDNAFDRVFCINTLEHLLRPQREALIASLARKLKPGGLLVLTSDYYFDSSWEQPAFLQAGVMRPDRAELFNGWNKVTPADWLALASGHDLHPLAGACDEPREGDATLYLNSAPYLHACIGGVFCRSHRPALPPGRKIVLGLLTWNTRQVSMESLHAHIREARMLQRLGQTPFICVCDNGSGDGTADALRAMDPQLEVPHRFLFNRENLGNSVARNQIIDYMLECDADYLLFMDGDIEIVPFSSFAMLRYMENNGHRLGCIGADSGWQTPHRDKASAYLYSVDGCQLDTTDLVAWTQYGMFRREVFEDGIRFDESGPFNGAGWGFEDNDLAFQMETKGYLNQRFFGMTYLHRDARSSIRIMRSQGIDAGALYSRRKQYVIDKWSSNSQINSGPLVHVRRVNMTV